MDGKYLYDLWADEMEACTTDDVDSWDDLNIAVVQAWDLLAQKLDLKEEA